MGDEYQQQQQPQQQRPRFNPNAAVFNPNAAAFVPGGGYGTVPALSFTEPRTR